jgi:hypothetical protein
MEDRLTGNLVDYRSWKASDMDKGRSHLYAPQLMACAIANSDATQIISSLKRRGIGYGHNKRCRSCCLCNDRCEIYTNQSTVASRLIHWNPGPSDGLASPRNSPAGRLAIECCRCERQLGVFIKQFTRSPWCRAQTLSPRVVTPQYISALRPVNKISIAIKTVHHSTHQSDHLPETKFAKVQRQSSLPIGTPAQRQIHK